MPEPIMSVKTLKSLISKEIDSHYSSACQTMYHDIQRSFIHNGYRLIKAKLENAQTYDDLQDVLDDMDYGMSLQDWLNSL